MKINKSKRSNSDLHFNLRDNSNRFVKCKRSQIAIFIIIGLIIVVSIALIYVFVNPPEVYVPSEQDPVGFIEQCLEEHLEEAVAKVTTKGGYIDEKTAPSGFLIDSRTGKPAPFLCYIEDTEEVCIGVEPALGSHAEQEIYEFIMPEVERCFNALQGSIGQGYSAEATNLEVEVKPSQVLVKINKKISILSEKGKGEYERFWISIESPLYDFIAIAADIINQETRCDCSKSCYPDMISIMRFNQGFDIKLFVNTNDERIYTLSELKSNKFFGFSTRNCIPKRI